MISKTKFFSGFALPGLRYSFVLTISPPSPLVAMSKIAHATQPVNLAARAHQPASYAQVCHTSESEPEDKTKRGRWGLQMCGPESRGRNTCSSPWPKYC